MTLPERTELGRNRPRSSRERPKTPDIYGNGVAEDIGALVRQLAEMGITERELRGQLDETFGQSKSAGPLMGLEERVDGIARGTWRSVPLPWPLLTTLSVPSLPGNNTIVTGGPGASKTLFSIQPCRAYMAAGIPFVMLAFEGDREQYLLRFLAQISGTAAVTSADWIAQNPERARGLLHRHAAELQEFSRHLMIARELGLENQRQVMAWAERMAEYGIRILIIDPISLINRDHGLAAWDSDQMFIRSLKGTAERHGCSIWLITHPVRGSEQPTRQNLSGGACYERMVDTILTLEHHELKTSKIKTDCGTIEVSHNRTIGIAKSRHGPGTNLKLAFNFNTTDLTLQECGIITRQTRKGHEW